MRARTWHRLPLALVVLVWLAAAPAAAGSQTGPERGGDSAARQVRSLSLAEALELADRNHPSLEAARASLLEAQAQFKASWAALLPVVSGSLVFTHNDKADRVDFGPQSLIARRQDDLAGSLRVDLPLLNGRMWYGVALASVGEEIAELGAEQTRQTLLLSVAQTYYQALTARALVNVNSSQIERNRRHLDSALARVRAGTGSALDVFRARTELVAARELLADARTGLRNTLDALVILTGVTGPVQLRPVGELRAPCLDESQLEQQALARREDLRLARANERLARRRLNSSWMDFLPSLVGSWQFSYQFTDPSSFRATDKARWLYFLTLSVPIYDHTRYADLDAQRAALLRAQAEHRDAEQQALLQIRQTRRDYENAVGQVATAGEKAHLAEKTMELAQAAYENGTGGALEVIDAQRSHLQAQIDLTMKRFSAQLALLRLLRASGENMMTVPDRLATPPGHP